MQRRALLSAALLSAFAATGLASRQVLAAPAPKVLRIGVTAGLHAEILEQVVPLARKNGLEIKIFEFQDYVQPNAALASGDLDANIFQTKPFLDAACKDRGYKLTPVAGTLTFPLAFYSKKYKSFKEIPNGSSIAIPNDPSQGGRALILLASAGLIELKNPKNLLSSVLDIKSNPHRFKFVELEAAQTPRALTDVAAAAVNGNYATASGLNPTRDGILSEGADSPYVNYIVVQEKDKNASWIPDLVKSYQQPTISKFIKTKYKGTVIPAF